MSKKVLILSGSPQKGGNSDLLCDEFMRGAQESGNDVEKIFIRDKKSDIARHIRMKRTIWDLMHRRNKK